MRFLPLRFLEELLACLTELTEAAPELRLGQMVVNLATTPAAPARTEAVVTRRRREQHPNAGAKVIQVEADQTTVPGRNDALVGSSEKRRGQQHRMAGNVQNGGRAVVEESLSASGQDRNRTVLVGDDKIEQAVVEHECAVIEDDEPEGMGGSPWRRPHV